jgi:hypothetical protein
MKLINSDKGLFVHFAACGCALCIAFETVSVTLEPSHFALDRATWVPIWHQHDKQPHSSESHYFAEPPRSSEVADVGSASVVAGASTAAGRGSASAFATVTHS